MKKKEFTGYIVSGVSIDDIIKWGGSPYTSLIISTFPGWSVWRDKKKDGEYKKIKITIEEVKD